MPAIIATEQNIKEINSFQYQLSIQILLDGFSFCIKEPGSDEIVYFYADKFEPSETKKSFIEWLENQITTNKLLKGDFLASKCFVQPNHYTLIPSDHFIKDKAWQLLNLHSPLKELDEIHFEDLSSTGMIMVYSIHTEIASIINELNPDIPIRSTIVNFHDTLPMSDKKIRFNINISKNSIDIILTNNSNLAFLNNIEYNSITDITYHIINVAKQFEIDLETAKMNVQGDITQNGKLYQMLKSMLPKIAFIDTNSVTGPLSLNKELKINYYALFKS